MGGKESRFSREGYGDEKELHAPGMNREGHAEKVMVETRRKRRRMNRQTRYGAAHRPIL